MSKEQMEGKKKIYAYTIERREANRKSSMVKIIKPKLQKSV